MARRSGPGWAACLAIAGVACGCSTLAPPRPAQAASTNAPSDVAAAGLARGKALYEAQCAACHGPRLDGGMGPPLTGEGFIGHWSGQAASRLADAILNTMPASAPGSLSDEQATDLALYVLDRNGSPLPENTSAKALSDHIIERAPK